MNEIPPWATHLAVDANGEVWAFEEEPVWFDAPYGHWEPVDNFDGLRFEIMGDEAENGHAWITDAARLLCVRVPRPDGWEPPPHD